MSFYIILFYFIVEDNNNLSSWQFQSTTKWTGRATKINRRRVGSQQNKTKNKKTFPINELWMLWSIEV